MRCRGVHERGVQVPALRSSPSGPGRQGLPRDPQQMPPHDSAVSAAVPLCAMQRKCRLPWSACGVWCAPPLRPPCTSFPHPPSHPPILLSLPPLPPPFHPPVVRHRQSSPHRPQHLLRNVGRAPLVSAADQFCTDQAARLSAPAQRTCQFIPAPTLYATSMPSPSVPIGTALVRT